MKTGALIIAGALMLTGCGGDNSAEFTDQADTVRDRGGFRTDRAATDVEVTPYLLAENFRRVAFGSDIAIQSGAPKRESYQSNAVLNRWAGPVRYALHGKVEADDLRNTISLAKKLRQATGLDIAPAGDAASSNLDIHFLDRPRRSGLLEALRESRLAEFANAWANAPEWPCAGEFYARRPTGPNGGEITYAVIYIRDELRADSRRSCIEEEVSQVLGLPRDDPTVRPSIFNYDEEFVFLTDHDVKLLNILYDDRLRAGMSRTEAMPLVRQIAEELIPPGPKLAARGTGGGG